MDHRQLRDAVVGPPSRHGAGQTADHPVNEYRPWRETIARGSAAAGKAAEAPALDCSNMPTSETTPMPITRLSSRELNQDTSRAKRAAEKGPVIITDRGRPAHVLLTYEDYQRLTGGEKSLVDLLGLPPGVEDAELEIPTLADPARPATFD